MAFWLGALERRAESERAGNEGRTGKIPRTRALRRVGGMPSTCGSACRRWCSVDCPKCRASGQHVVTKAARRIEADDRQDTGETENHGGKLQRRRTIVARREMAADQGRRTAPSPSAARQRRHRSASAQDEEERGDDVQRRDGADEQPLPGVLRPGRGRAESAQVKERKPRKTRMVTSHVGPTSTTATLMGQKGRAPDDRKGENQRAMSTVTGLRIIGMDRKEEGGAFRASCFSARRAMIVRHPCKCEGKAGDETATVSPRNGLASPGRFRYP
ncbi:MAG: hypothetical protein R3D02_11840 [Hyphomicrobiales bacterium]